MPVNYYAQPSLARLRSIVLGSGLLAVVDFLTGANGLGLALSGT